MKTKSRFELLDYNCEVLKSICPSAEIFSDVWFNYLEGMGWDEDRYDNEAVKRAFGDNLLN